MQHPQWPVTEYHAMAAGGPRDPEALAAGVESGHLLCVRNRDVRFGLQLARYTGAIVEQLREAHRLAAAAAAATTTPPPPPEPQAPAPEGTAAGHSQELSHEDAQVLNVGQHQLLPSRRRQGRVLGGSSHRVAGGPMLRSHEPDEGPAVLRACNAYVSAVSDYVILSC